MKSPKTLRSFASGKNRRRWLRALLLGCVALNRAARGQDVLAPGPEGPDQTPPAVQMPNPMDVFANPPPTEGEPLKWGSFVLRPHPYYQYLYADGLRPSTNAVTTSSIQTIAPGVLLQAGSHWTLDYVPIWTLYSSPLFANSFGQSAKLVGGTVYKDWFFQLSQGYADITAPSTVTANELQTRTFTTELVGTHSINSKLSLDLAVDQSFISADQFSSYDEWSTLNWLNYQFRPTLVVALGVGLGYDHEPSGPEMSFEQLQGRIEWRATEKLSFRIHGGMENRQFLTGDTSAIFNPVANNVDLIGNAVNPIFDATIQYKPFAQTRLSVTGQRVVSASYLPGEVTETTAGSADINQRLLGKFFLDLSANYQTTKYTNASQPRRDDYYSIGAQLSHVFLKRGTISVLYDINRDISTLPGYSYLSHQVGVQIGFAY